MKYETIREQQLKDQINDLQEELNKLIVKRLIRDELKIIESQPKATKEYKYNDDDLLDGEQTAKLLGVKKATLDVWRHHRRVNLPYIKVGRLVKYKFSDIAKFIEGGLK